MRRDERIPAAVMPEWNGDDNARAVLQECAGPGPSKKSPDELASDSSRAFVVFRYATGLGFFDLVDHLWPRLARGTWDTAHLFEPLAPAVLIDSHACAVLFLEGDVLHSVTDLFSFLHGAPVDVMHTWLWPVPIPLFSSDRWRWYADQLFSTQEGRFARITLDEVQCHRGSHAGRRAVGRLLDSWTVDRGDDSEQEYKSCAGDSDEDGLC